MQIRSSTLHGWINKYKEGNEIHRGSRNYASDEAKENARLRKELRDAKNALEILKSDRHPGRLTEKIFLQTAILEEELKQEGQHRLNVSGMPRTLGVSRSGYHSFKKRESDPKSSRKHQMKSLILDIHLSRSKYMMLLKLQKG